MELSTRCRVIVRENGGICNLALILSRRAHPPQPPTAPPEPSAALLETPSGLLEAPSALLEAPSAPLEAPSAPLEAPAALLEVSAALLGAPSVPLEASLALAEAPTLLLERSPRAGRNGPERLTNGNWAAEGEVRAGEAVNAESQAVGSSVDSNPGERSFQSATENS